VWRNCDRRQPVDIGQVFVLSPFFFILCLLRYSMVLNFCTKILYINTQTQWGPMAIGNPAFSSIVLTTAQDGEQLNVFTSKYGS
jgi:hypothetical protein